MFEFLPHCVIVKAGLGSPFSRTTLEKTNQYRVILRVWQWQWFWDSNSEKDRKEYAPLLLLPRATFGGLHSIATSALTLYGGPSDFVHGTVIITFCYESARACLCLGGGIKWLSTVLSLPHSSGLCFIHPSLPPINHSPLPSNTESKSNPGCLVRVELQINHI